jgi:hypothetical protein
VLLLHPPKKPLLRKLPLRKLPLRKPQLRKPLLRKKLPPRKKLPLRKLPLRKPQLRKHPQRALLLKLLVLVKMPTINVASGQLWVNANRTLCGWHRTANKLAALANALKRTQQTAR